MNASITRVVAAVASLAITFFVFQSVADIAKIEQATPPAVQLAQAASATTSAIR